jgi:hypothetical protein
MRLDYGYRFNGTRGYLHAVAIGRDPGQAKVLAYTAERIRQRGGNAGHVEFTAITETDAEPSNPLDQFAASLFAEQGIATVPPNRAERFAEDLRMRIQ